MSQEFDNNVLDLVKKNEFDPYEYITNFKKSKEIYQAKKSFIICEQVKKLGTKNMIMFIRFVSNDERLSQFVFEM